MEQFLFTIPLFFQVVLSESASKAGIRLIIPSLGTPVGGLIAGYIMSRWGMLNHLVRLGCLLMVVGNGVMATLNYHDSSWKYIVYLFPANLGQGIVFPSMLFTNIAAFQQSRKYQALLACLREKQKAYQPPCRTSSFNLNGLPFPLYGQRLGRRSRIHDNTERPLVQAARGIVRNTR